MSDAIDDSNTITSAVQTAGSKPSDRQGTSAGDVVSPDGGIGTPGATGSGAASDDVETEAFALSLPTGAQDVLDSYTAPDDDGADMEVVGESTGDGDAAGDAENAGSDASGEGTKSGGDDPEARKRLHLTDYVADNDESHSHATSHDRGSASDGPGDYSDDESDDSTEYRSMRNQFSTAFDLIDSLIDEVNEAPGGVFNHDMARINRTNLVDELTNLKKLLPVQLSHASNLMRQANYRLDDAQTEANSIVSDAKAKAAKIISAAEDRAEFLAGQENVVAIANDKARTIMKKAQEKADKLTIGADEYCENVMGELSKQLQHISASVNEGVRVIGERKATAQSDLEALNSQLARDDEQ